VKFLALVLGLIVRATENTILWTHMHVRILHQGGPTSVYPRATLVMNIYDVNNVFGLLHRVDVGDVTNVSEVQPTCTFRVEVCASFCVYIEFCFETERGRVGDRMGIGASSGPVRTVGRGSCASGPFKGLGVLKKSPRQLMFWSGHPSKCLQGRAEPGEQWDGCSLVTHHSTLGIVMLLSNALNKGVKFNSLK
jgi:hypothetical protein